jgi:hypothetical protein
VERQRTIECAPIHRWKVVLFIVALPTMFSAWVLKDYWLVGQMDAAVALVVVGVIFGLCAVPGLWFGSAYMSRVRMDRLGVHRESLPLLGGSIRWSDIEEIEVRSDAKATEIVVHGPSRRIVLTDKTHSDFDAAEQRLYDEAEYRDIPMT